MVSFVNVSLNVESGISYTIFPERCVPILGGGGGDDVMGYVAYEHFLMQSMCRVR
jgi:hypothetical protein